MSNSPSFILIRGKNDVKSPEMTEILVAVESIALVIWDKARQQSSIVFHAFEDRVPLLTHLAPREIHALLEPFLYAPQPQDKFAQPLSELKEEYWVFVRDRSVHDSAPDLKKTP